MNIIEYRIIMKTSNTFGGFRYQKKCAFLYLLNHHFKHNFKQITLEHPLGDDFDMHFIVNKDVYQTKKRSNLTTMKSYIKKMWRRYSENIREHSDIEISLCFIFSKNFSVGAFSALRDKDYNSKALRNLYNSIIKDGNKDMLVPLTKEEWDNFIRILSLEIIEEDRLDEALHDLISNLYNAYRITESEKRNVCKTFLDLLDEAMSDSAELTKEKIQNEIDVWHCTFLEKHKGMTIYRYQLEKDLEKVFKEEHKLEPIPANSTGEEL